MFNCPQFYFSGPAHDHISSVLSDPQLIIQNNGKPFTKFLFRPPMGIRTVGRLLTPGCEKVLPGLAWLALSQTIAFFSTRPRFLCSCVIPSSRNTRQRKAIYKGPLPRGPSVPWESTLSAELSLHCLSDPCVGPPEVVQILQNRNHDLRTTVEEHCNENKKILVNCQT